MTSRNLLRGLRISYESGAFSIRITRYSNIAKAIVATVISRRISKSAFLNIVKNNRMAKSGRLAVIEGAKVEKDDTSVIEEIVRRIMESVHPEKIVLFGSYVYGEPHSCSDLDILVVMESKLPRYKRAIPIYSALADLLIPMDILVYTPGEIEDWREVPGSFISSVLRKGKVIYEKRAL